MPETATIHAAGAPAEAEPTGPTFARPASRKPVRRSGFAGFSWGQLGMGVALVGLIGWNAWLTREVVALQGKRIVSVSLAAMANDFVMAEARAGNSPEQTDADTRHYMSTLQKVLKERADRGEVILVGEAVVSGSVPDLTPDVRAAVGRLITANPPPRIPESAAMKPPANGNVLATGPTVLPGATSQMPAPPVQPGGTDGAAPY